MKRQNRSAEHRVKKSIQRTAGKGRIKLALPAAAGAVILLAVIFLIWRGGGPGLVKLTVEDGKYKNRKDSVAYLPADINYEPFAVGEQYAKAGNTILYVIDGLDPSLWLTEKYSGVGSIYHADTIVLPGLEGWQADSVLICESDEITIMKAEVTEADSVAAIVAAATQNPLDFAPADAVTESGGYRVYHLKFTSALFDRLYYDLIYLDNGINAYFYNRTSKLYYDAGTLLVNWLPRDAADDLIS